MNKWYNWANEFLSGFGILLSVDLMETKEILGIILLILNILVLIISYGIKIWKWFEKSLEDKHITSDELEGLEEIVEDIKEKINGDETNE